MESNQPQTDSKILGGDFMTLKLIRLVRSSVSIGLLSLLSWNVLIQVAESASPLDRWRTDVSVQPVLEKNAQVHSVHSYFNTSPESPDGKQVLFFRSKLADAQSGEVCIKNKQTGEIKVLAGNIEVEDVHRVACQQWSCDGKEVVFHQLHEDSQCQTVIVDGEEVNKFSFIQYWRVAAFNLQSEKIRELTSHRQLSWGVPSGEVVPIYGPHWEPGDHPDLELVNVASREIKTVLTSQQVREDNAAWFAKVFDDKPTSIFFPILSPDGKKVLFKIATPAGGDFRSKEASQRTGLFCYDLTTGKMLCSQPSWGHPAWHPNSQEVINVRRSKLVIMTAETGVERPLPNSPTVPGSHPSFSPDGSLFVTDLRIEDADAEPGTWAVMVGDVRTGEHVEIHRFRNNRGANSWRVSHPHPVFSPDGKRIYYNVSADRFTRLYVAEAGK